jgi:hypothetical protein
MENTVFPYDAKWEQVEFQPAAKRIISFQDVTEYQQRPIHDEYLDFLADLQKVSIPARSPSSPKRYLTPQKHPNSPSSSPFSKNWKSY